MDDINPTDILHGKEWKSHKYIKKVMNNGKWAYYYAVNRAKGNRVTNRTVGSKGRQYSPTVSTKYHYGSTNNMSNVRFSKNSPNFGGTKVLTEPISSFFDPAVGSQGPHTYKAIDSLIKNKKRKESYNKARNIPIR